MTSIFHSAIRLILTLSVSFISATAWGSSATSDVPLGNPSPAIPHTKHIKGTITSVTPSSLTILNKKTNTSHTFKFSPETPVFRSCHCQGTLSDLSVGQHVRVKFSPDDLKVATVHIWKHHKSQKSKECLCSPSDAHATQGPAKMKEPMTTPTGSHKNLK